MTFSNRVALSEHSAKKVLHGRYTWAATVHKGNVCRVGGTSKGGVAPQISELLEGSARIKEAQKMSGQNTRRHDAPCRQDY
jgi:hypothetical protein